MIPIILEKRKEISRACERFKVEELSLFGSAVTGLFRPGESDLDFVAEFVDRAPTGEYADRFLDFAEELERLFECPVHLISNPSIRNPYLLREIENTRQVL